MRVVCWNKYNRSRCEIDPQELSIYMWFEHKVKGYPPSEKWCRWRLGSAQETVGPTLHCHFFTACERRGVTPGLVRYTMWKLLPVNPATMESLKSCGKSNRNSSKNPWMRKNSQKMNRRCWKVVNQQKPCHSWKVVIHDYLTKLSSWSRWERRNFCEGEEHTSFIQELSKWTNEDESSIKTPKHLVNHGGGPVGSHDNPQLDTRVSELRSPCSLGAECSKN